MNGFSRPDGWIEHSIAITKDLFLKWGQDPWFTPGSETKWLGMFHKACDEKKEIDDC